MLDLGDEAISAAGECLDILGVFGRVAESIAELVYGGIQAMIEVNEGVARPKLGPKFLARDQLPGTLNQDRKNLKWLPYKFEPCSMLPQFVGVQVDLIRPETHPP